MHALKSRFLEFKPALLLFYLSLTGFFGVMSVQHYLRLRPDPVICLCSMGMVFGIYTFNRFTDATEDFANDIGKFLFFQEKRVFLVLAVGALAASVGTLVFMEKLNLFHLLLLLTGFCYSSRMVPWYSRSEGLVFVRLKEVILVKNLLVSIWWPAGLLAVPILYSTQNASFSNTSFSKEGFSLGLIGGALFLAILNNTLLHDIMDETGDRIAGIKTLPTVWGPRRSLALLWMLDGAWLIGILSLLLARLIDPGHAAFLAILVLYPALYLALYAAGKASRPLMEFLSETDLVLFSIGMLLLAGS
jgi:4-hydroxybenzoate polyprenyltransferase